MILVVKDGEAWLRSSLAALAKQTYRRLGVIGVDNASTDASPDILEGMLGAVRVVRLERNVGFPAAVAEGLRRAGNAANADYLLLLHDDTLLARDAVQRMVEAAERIDRAGVIGPKIVDWEDPSILREVGLSADRFGYPYSPLEEEELDQGQYDRAREVLFVSSSAMLVSRAAWQRAGLPDERYGSHHEDMDFCWRVRLAGFRVLMTPRAVARHRGASLREERRGTLAARRARYYAERAGLASLLKNYSVLSLLWVLPLYLALGIGRMGMFLLERRLAEAWQIVAGWGWNLLHLPGTVRRRVRSQAVRSVPDREIRRFMAPAGMRLRRAGQQVSALLLGSGRLEEDEVIERPPLRARAGGFAMAHPVALAWLAGGALAILAYRNLLGASPLTGGAIGVVPDGAAALFREFTSAWRGTALGGAQPASPALAVLGAGSWLTLGNAELFHKLLLLGLPALAGVAAYRAILSVGGRRGSAVLGATCYTLSAIGLYALSHGRLDLLVLLTAMPWLAYRFWSFFHRPPPARPWKQVVGAGLALALAAAFAPGVVLAVPLIAFTGLIVPGVRGGRLRGIRLTVVALVVAAVLLFPMLLQFVAAPHALADGAGRASFTELARLALGRAPGGWMAALFLPLAAVLGLAFVQGDDVRWAVRATLVAVLSLGLAWAAAARYLPLAVANPAVYVALAAFAYCLILGLALKSIVLGVTRHAFGIRQFGLAAIVTLVAGGLVLQAFQAARGAWAIGEDRMPPAWPVVADDEARPFHVLWLADVDAAAFPPPGGLPQGRATGGGRGIVYSITDAEGASQVDVGRPAAGDGYRYLETALGSALSGRVRHLGALLAPLAVRYVVSGPGQLPPGVRARLDAQVDLDLVQTTGGLVMFRNSRAVPPAAIVRDASWAAEAAGAELTDAVMLERPATGRMHVPATGVRTGIGPGTPFLAEQHDAGWTLRTEDGGTAAAEEAFGWAMLFPAQGEEPFVVVYGRQWERTLSVALLALLWGAAVWTTRRSPRAPPR